jgi:hypothetical protein
MDASDVWLREEPDLNHHLSPDIVPLNLKGDGVRRNRRFF